MIAIYKRISQFFGQIVGYASIALFVLLPVCMSGSFHLIASWSEPSYLLIPFAWAPIFLILVVSAATIGVC